MAQAAACGPLEKTMTFKRKALGALTRVELLEVGKALDLDVTTGMRLDEMMDVVAGSKKRGILEKVLALLSRDTLKSICFAVGISTDVCSSAPAGSRRRRATRQNVPPCRSRC